MAQGGDGEGDGGEDQEGRQRKEEVIGAQACTIHLIAERGFENAKDSRFERQGHLMASMVSWESSPLRDGMLERITTDRNVTVVRGPYSAFMGAVTTFIH
jgi:hypothetical protein